MPLPNFICVGAQKAGTSTLFDVLKQSPDIYFPEKKEIHFFEKPEQYEKGIEYYKSLFDKNYNKEKLIGEITPEYLFYNYVPQRIYNNLGPIKIIILLRNPILRSFSQFNFHKMYQAESLNSNFFNEIEKEKLKENVNLYNTWCTPTYYLSKSLYFNQVKRYIDVFGKDNVYVGIFEELISKNELNLNPIFDFLGVPNFNYSQTHSNVSLINKNNKSFNFLSSVKRKVDMVIPKSITKNLSNSLKKQMTQAPKKLEKKEQIELNKKYFISDIHKLEELLVKDLSNWYSE